MKRCWFGAAVLVLLLVLGLLLSLFTTRFWEDLGKDMARAAEQAQAEAVESAGQVHARWQKRRPLAAVLCDHAVLEAIEENFHILTPDAENYREICLRLAAQLHALAQAQKLTLENVF